MTQMTQTPVTPKHLDAIREVVNIGAGHAATNLSALTGLRVMISVPRIQFATGEVEVGQELPGTGPLEQSALNEMGNIVCAAYVGVLGTFLGKGVMIGTPELHEGGRTDLAHHVSGLMIETDFTFLDTTFEGVFVLSHTDVSFSSLLRALGFSDVPAGPA